MYVYPISDVIKNKNFDFHLYADDTQLYSSFKASNLNASLTAMSDCASDINEWMIANKLKMNTDKTEVMLCGTSSKLKSINVDSADICDDTVSFSSHVQNVCISCVFRLLNSCPKIAIPVQNFTTNLPTEVQIHAN